MARQGLRHDWFAQQLGISKWMLSHYLAGRRTPPARFYREAGLVLKVPESTLRPHDPEPAVEDIQPREEVEAVA
jgi:transcriptional regulator with XRE-family HTH domain